MKAVGIAVLLAQAGMFVPCAELELAPFGRVLTRIGMHDDLFRGRSTFMCEMLELRDILACASPRSLVLGDELCAGTEPQSALAIVGAAVVHLRAAGAAFLLATHLHGLPDVPEVAALDGVEAMHLRAAFDAATGTLVLDRRLAPGRGLATYGLEVLRGLDMPREFMRCADKIRRTAAGVPESLVRRRQSRHNADVLLDRCGVCGAPATQTHHIVPQSAADAGGFVPATKGHAFHKNRAFNLVALCDACHEDVHHGDLRVTGFVQTVEGVRLECETVAAQTRQ
jgi:DNA mismatch repair protein MutS